MLAFIRWMDIINFLKLLFTVSSYGNSLRNNLIETLCMHMRAKTAPTLKICFVWPQSPAEYFIENRSPEKRKGKPLVYFRLTLITSKSHKTHARTFITHLWGLLLNQQSSTMYEAMNSGRERKTSEATSYIYSYSFSVHFTKVCFFFFSLPWHILKCHTL